MVSRGRVSAQRQLTDLAASAPKYTVKFAAFARQKNVPSANIPLIDPLKMWTTMWKTERELS